MSNVDPRLELARQIAGNRRPVPVAPLAPTGGGPALRRTVSGETRGLMSDVQDETTSLLRRFPDLGERVQQAKENKPSGVAGVLGRVLSNPIAQTALKPLIVLDTGRRAVISAGRELVDILDTDPKTKASISDFVAQTKDETFGFGTAFPMKGNWGRFTGFVGDVALDPLTYATLGVGKAATGLTARLALANKYLNKFDDAAKAARVAQFGKAALDTEEIASLGLKRSGVYFFGDKIRVPLSGPLGEAMLSGVTRARVGFTNTRFGSTLQKNFIGMGGRGDEALRDIRLALARGEQLPNNMSAKAGIKYVAGENARRAAAGAAFDAVRRRMTQEIGSVGKETMDSYRNVAYKWLEGTATPQTPNEVAFYERFKTLFDDLWDDVDADYKRLTPDSTGVGRIKEYFPWVMTDAAKDLTTNMETPWVKDLMSYLAPNPLDPTGSFKSRNLKTGAEFLWTVDGEGKKIPYILTADDLNLDRINQISRNALGVDFFETDLEKVLFSYANSYSQQKGLVALYGSLAESGVIREMTRRGVMDEEAVLAAAAAADKAVDNVLGGLNGAAKQLRDLSKTIGKRVQGEVSRLQGVADDAAAGFARSVGAMSADGPRLFAEIFDAGDVVKNLKIEIEQLKGSFDSLFFSDVPDEVKALYDQYDRLTADLTDIEKQIDGFNARVKVLEEERAALGTAKEITDPYFTELERTLQKSFDDAVRKFEDAVTNQQIYTELNAVLKDRFDDILDGVMPRDLKLGRVKSILAGSQRKLPKREGFVSSIEDYGATPGSLNDWVKAPNSPVESQMWFTRIQNRMSKALFNKTRLSKMSYRDVLDISVRAAPTYNDGVELVNAAAFLLSRDLKFYGDDVATGALGSVHAQLVNAVEEASSNIGLIENQGRRVANQQTLRRLEDELADYTNVIHAMNDTATTIGELQDARNIFANFGDQVLSNEDFALMSDSVVMVGDTVDARTASDLVRAIDSVVPRLTGQTFNIGNETFGVNDLDFVISRFEAKEAVFTSKVNASMTSDLKGLSRRELIQASEDSIANLAEAVTSYALASEVQRRFTALGKELAMFGLVPTEEMYAVAMRRVGEEFLERTVAREASVSAAKLEMEKIRTAVMEAMSKDIDKAEGGKGFVAVFDRMLEEAYNGPNGAALLEVMGPLVLYTSDAPKMLSKYELLKSASQPYVSQSREFYDKWAFVLGESPEVVTNPKNSDINNLIKRIVEDETGEVFGKMPPGTDVDAIKAKARELFELRETTKSPSADFLRYNMKEWFENAFPGRKYSKQALLRELRTSPARNQKMMRDFFTDLLGGHYRSNASYQAKVGRSRYSSKGGRNAMMHKSPSGEYIAVHADGSINSELNVLRARSGTVRAMLDPSTNYREFLNDPFGIGATPLSAADSLESLARELEKDIRFIQPSVKPIVQAEKEAVTAEGNFKRLEKMVMLMEPRGAQETAAEYRARIRGLLDDLDPRVANPFVAPEPVVTIPELPRLKNESDNAYEARLRVHQKQTRGRIEREHKQVVADARKAWEEDVNRQIKDLTKLYERQSSMAQDFAEVRKMREAHNELVASPEYVAATRDRDITNMILGFANIDGWKASHNITGESGWFINPKNPNVSFDGILATADPAERSTLLGAQPSLRVMQRVNIDDLAGVELDGVYVISPDKGSVIPATRDNVKKIASHINKLRKEVREFDRAGGATNPSVTTDYLMRIQSIKKQVEDWDNNRWTYARLNEFGGRKNHLVGDVVYVQPEVSTRTEGSIFERSTIGAPEGVQGAMVGKEARTALPQLFEKYTSKRATFVDAESLAQRQQLADVMLRGGQINQTVYERLISEKESINNILASQMPNGLTVETTIGPAASKALRDMDKPISFTKEEWLALYEPLSPKEMSRVAREIGQVGKRLEQFRGLAARGQASVTIGGERFNVGPEINRMTAQLEELRLLAKTGSIDPKRQPAALQSALAKMEQLYDQLEGSYTGKSRSAQKKAKEVGEIAANGAIVSDASRVTRRRSAVRQKWEATDSYRVLGEAKDTTRSPEMVIFRQTETARSNASSAAADARKKATELRGSVSSTESNIVDIVRTSQMYVDTFTPEGAQLLEEVSKILGKVIKTSEDGVKSAELKNLNLKLPQNIKRAADEIRKQFVSPAERTFVEAIVGKEFIAEQVFESGADIARARIALESLQAVKKADDEYLVTLSNIIAGKAAPLRTAAGNAPAIPLPLTANPVLRRKAAEQAKADLQKRINAVEKQIRTLTKASKTANDKKVADIAKQIGVLEDEMSKSIIKMNMLQNEYDSILPNLVSAEETMEYVNTFITPKIQELQEILKRMQQMPGMRKGMKVTPQNYMDIVSVIDDFKVAINELGLDPNDPINKVFAEVANVQAEFIGRLNTAAYMQSELIGNANFTNFERTLSEGFASLESVGLRGMEAPKEVVDMFENMRRLKDPAFQRDVMRFLQNYTKFFKSYATLSPGFHVRNAMSNTFALVAAGANPKRFSEGLSMYIDMRRAFERGLTLDQWIETLPEAQRSIADVAARSMFASGGGQTSDAFRGMARREKGIRGGFEDNFLLRGSRKVGAELESSSRFMLGYDSAIQGLDFDQSAARVRRYMFDYEDVGRADEVMRTIIPFWMWASRALPLHLTNQWLNPKPYAIYYSFKRNFQADEEEGDIAPSWIKERGGFKIGKDTFLIPDLGFQNLEQQVAQFGDPQRLLSQANPLLRLPIELAGGRRLYNNQPFKEQPQQVEGGVAALLQPLLQIAGYGETGPGGERFVDEKALYALQSLVPFLAQGERLLPSTESGQERQGQSLLSYLGVPVRQVSEREKQGQLLGELMRLRELGARQEALGGG